jgi:hypothetical protein
MTLSLRLHASACITEKIFLNKIKFISVNSRVEDYYGKTSINTDKKNVE